MATSEQTIHQLYTALTDGEISKIDSCYATTVKFHDPIFGVLNNDEVPAMWKMLIERSNRNLKIQYNIITINEYTATVEWKANYTFGKKKRNIENQIRSHFHFKEGLIIKQNDDFNIWNWCKQAFGGYGFFLGWTGYMQHKIQVKALSSLKKYIENKSN